LQQLLRERISIRDLLTILETLADYVPITKDVDKLIGYVRACPVNHISRRFRFGQILALCPSGLSGNADY